MNTNFKGAERDKLRKKWNKIRDMVHQTAVDHGWHDEERTFNTYACLFHCELSEAFEELRKGEGHEYYKGENGKPEGFYVELVDCIIRMLDWLGQENLSATPIFPDWKPDKERRADSIAAAHSQICSAQDWKWDIRQRKPFIKAAIGTLVAVLESEGQDVFALIREKDAYNKTRPYRHNKVM